MRHERWAVYTAVYPGAAQYLREWHSSLRAQTDQDFDLWISVDSIRVADVVSAIGLEPHATWIVATPGETVAEIRQNAIQRIVEKYDAIVFVDSDDVLEPDRVEAARAALQGFDVSGCALRVINEAGRDLGIVFEPDPHEEITSYLFQYNVFGLSNTAYRADMLRRCLPVPAHCILIDWLLATRSLFYGGKLIFDHTPHMQYRQYAENVARVVPPFRSQDVLLATERVLNHYECVRQGSHRVPSAYEQKLTSACARVEEFYQRIKGSADILSTYVTSLNQLPPRFVWWWSVANPDLEHLWKN